MNDYQNFLGFLGNPPQLEKFHKPFQEFEEQAKSIQQKLGSKSYLLYRYIEMMFTTQAHRYIYNATDDGFEACAETLRFCNAISGGKPVDNNADAELIASAVKYGERLKIKNITPVQRFFYGKYSVDAFSVKVLLIMKSLYMNWTRRLIPNE